MLRPRWTLGLLLLAGCSSGRGQQPPGGAATIDISPPAPTLLVGSSLQLSAVVKDSDGVVLTNVPLGWQSTATGVAAVNASGQVTGVAVGSAIIKAVTGAVRESVTVTVQMPAAGSVTLVPNQVSVSTGNILQLVAVARDQGGSPISTTLLSWTSSNTAVAAVRPGGFVVPAQNGTATITATVNNVSGSAQVTVQGGVVRADTLMVPLLDMGSTTYLSYRGGLYPDGNAIPPAHLAAGIASGQAVVPRDTAGTTSAGGKYLLLSIGLSNTTQEWCAQNYDDPCNSWSFMGQAAASSAVETTGLAIVNGAKGGQTAPNWLTSGQFDYLRVRDSMLEPRGLSEKQVEVIWLKLANGNPTVSLPRSTSDAFVFEGQLGQIVRTLKQRYPNLRQVLLSSRIYAGYAVVPLNPEPYAYESGFAVKWLIEAQIRQMVSGGGTIDPVAGNLDYNNGTAPWLAWAPYLWADGTHPRSDGLTWPRGDLESDGTHPSNTGEQKVGSLLLTYFLNTSYTACWFAKTGSCP